MVENKREEISQSQICHYCGKTKKEHHQNGANVFHCTPYEDKSNTREFYPAIPSVTAATSKKLLDEQKPSFSERAEVKLKEAYAADPICRNCGQRKSIHHPLNTEVARLEGESLFCFPVKSHPSNYTKFETLQPQTKDLRLDMEVVTRDKLASQLAQERGLVKSTDPVSIDDFYRELEEEPDFNPLRLGDMAPTMDELTQPLIRCVNCTNLMMNHFKGGMGQLFCTPYAESKEFKAPADDPVTIKTHSKSVQIVNAIQLAKMVDDLKLERTELQLRNENLRHQRDSNMKVIEELRAENAAQTRKISSFESDFKVGKEQNRRLIKEAERMGKEIAKIRKDNDSLRTIAAREGEAIFQVGRRSMDKWVVLSFGAGLILGIVGYVFIY